MSPLKLTSSFQLLYSIFNYISSQDDVVPSQTTDMARGELGPGCKFTRRKKTLAFAGIILAVTALTRIIYSTSPDEIRAADLMRQWCRIRRARVDWEQMLKPCKGKIQWGSKLPGWESEYRTDPDESYISLWDIRPCGEFSRLSIRTVASNGLEKRIGGDSWRVQLKGPASVAGTVFDHMNGTYEVLFLIIEPGDYQVEAILDHSLCDGFTDPPPNWFVVGMLRCSLIYFIASVIDSNYVVIRLKGLLSG